MIVILLIWCQPLFCLFTSLFQLSKAFLSVSKWFLHILSLCLFLLLGLTFLSNISVDVHIYWLLHRVLKYAVKLIRIWWESARANSWPKYLVHVFQTLGLELSLVALSIIIPEIIDFFSYFIIIDEAWTACQVSEGIGFWSGTLNVLGNCFLELHVVVF